MSKKDKLKNFIKQVYNDLHISSGGEIAQLDELKWNHNNCCYRRILKFAPNNVDICLDIGCGKGELSFML